MEPDVIPINLDVSDMANLFDGRERLTGYTFPRRRRPVLELRRDRGVMRFKLLRKAFKRAEGDGIHVRHLEKESGSVFRKVDYSKTCTLPLFRSYD